MNAKQEVLNKVPDAVIRCDDYGAYHVCSDSLNLTLYVANIQESEESAWQGALNRLNSNIVILPCGIAIRDDRELGLGLSVLRNGVKRWVKLGVSKSNEKWIFYVSATGTWLEPSEVNDYIGQLQFIKQAAIEANEYFGGKL